MGSAHFQAARQAAKLDALSGGDAEVIVRLGKAKLVGLDVRIDGHRPKALWIAREVMLDDKGDSGAHVLQFHTDSKNLKGKATVAIQIDGQMEGIQVETKDGGKTWSNRWFRKRYYDASNVQEVRVYGDGMRHLKTVVETREAAGSIRLDSGNELTLVVFDENGPDQIVTVTRKVEAGL